MPSDELLLQCYCSEPGEMRKCLRHKDFYGDWTVLHNHDACDKVGW